ncbi:uncharacterized protein [Mytilus edulis]|uniref:uncharacterized protein isoform X2 n=1 Tax=Mytilus edulis TaxID=6550 RepID=UPI0039EFC0D1
MTEITDTISVLTFVRLFLVFQMLISDAYFYNFKCPSEASWKFRAEVECNSTSNYFCLYNNVDLKYVEGCNGPDWDRKGSKRIYVGDFSRGKCKSDRFQPFKFFTNESMTDCYYAKSNCSEEGQILQEKSSSKEDRRCRCNHEKNYAFIKTPRNVCFCIPTEEDCSCYIKSCPVNQTLAADYICTHNENLGKSKCKDIHKYYVTLNETTEVRMGKNSTWLNKSTSKQRDKFIVFIICCIIIICGFVVVVFLKWKNETQELFRRCFMRRKTDPEKIGVIKNEHGNISTYTVEGYETKSPESTLLDEEQSVYKIEDNVDSKVTAVNIEEHHLTIRDTEEATISAKEVDIVETFDKNDSKSLEITAVNCEKVEPRVDDIKYYLRIVHLLFRVVCPVVRMYFNQDTCIKPEQLRKTLDTNKAQLRRKYRMKDFVINNDQWKLLYDHVKGKTLTSEDFDLGLMIYLLPTIKSIDLGDLYPVKTNTRINATLTRIKYIRNNVIQSIVESHSDENYHQFLDDLEEAVLNLLPPHTYFKENDKDKKQLIDRLLLLNPINVNNDKLFAFIAMSEIYPSIILQKLISEFLTLNELKIEQVLEEEKHQLYHKRHKTEKCCTCIEISATYMKVLTEEQWEALYELRGCTNSNDCKCMLKICSKSVVPRKDFKLDSCDLSLVVSLILYIPKILKYFLCIYGFRNFLVNYQHTIYHYMENKRCCKCKEQLTGKLILKEKEWNKIFIRDNNKSCQNSNKNCCCRYKPIDGIECSNVKATLLSKIVYAAGPISVLTKIGQETFLYFINWTIDDVKLSGALKELLRMIKPDETFSRDILHRITSSNFTQLDKTLTQHINPHRWISRHLQHQQATTGKSLQILLLDKDDLHVKSVQIPKDFPLPHRTNYMTDLTTDENNFLVVVYVLKQILCPVIKNEFTTQCPKHVLDEIRDRISELQKPRDLRKVESKSGKEKIYLTQDQQTRLISQKGEESKNLDLELMVYILKQRSNSEWNKNYIEHLDEIEKIRGEIVQSKSGTLDQTTFEDFMDRICKAVTHLGGQKYTEELSSLQHIKNILE